MIIWPGQPYPLGATYDGTGVNFSVYSELAERLELCLFDENDVETRVDLPEVTSFSWHGYIPGLQPGQRYGFRAHGPWAPGEGRRCNPHKLLLDPYAKAIDGMIRWDEAVFPHYFDDPFGKRNEADSAARMPRSVVINPFFDWADDRQPKTAAHKSIIYETHVKGFSMKHPKLPPEIRGTYAAMGHPITIDYLLHLGITAVELMPIHQFVHDAHLIERGLRNYWGYNSIGFFAPHNEYSSRGGGQQVQEFKQMVKTFHAAGIEVILDVVYNHTAEGNHLGPMLSMKGLDNPSYYRLVNDDRRYYMDYTGTGNTLNVRHPQVLQLIMDSLRYWITEMRVDGFRFDLAAALARELHDVDRLSAFFDLIHQDPIVSQVKLIAEPWDVGEGGYQVGNFPPNWSEWNGKYRDCVREYWKGTDQSLAEYAYRFTGSSDLYETTGRKPFASINFITAHDGFCLHDLVSFHEKRNEPNGEENRDGENHNRSWNCGVEGPSDDPEINALRNRQKRNFLASLLLSQGIPMLLGGDEIGRTQQGNNNAYCQDNEISWHNWDADAELLEFTSSLIRLRKEHPVFRRRKFFMGRSIRGASKTDIAWFRPDGQEMSEDDWGTGYVKSLAVFLNGKGLSEHDVQGEPIEDDSFLVLFNAHHESLDFRLPQDLGGLWVKVLDTSENRPAQFKGSRTIRELLPLTEEAPRREMEENHNLHRELDQALHDLAGLAALVCEAPLACISLMEENRQWFKSGLEVKMPELPKAIASFSHSILTDQLVEVPDTTGDERFASSAMVSARPPLRFYAGAPLISSAGQAIGAICVLDRNSRHLTTAQRQGLQALARQVVTYLGIRRQFIEGTQTANHVQGSDPDPFLSAASIASSMIKAEDPVELKARSLVLLRLSEAPVSNSPSDV
jgi:isoamylase